MHGAGVLYEVEPGPGIPGKEFGGEEIAFQAIAAAAGGDEVPGGVLAAFGEREDVIDGGEVEVERRGAVDAAATAITHHGVLYRSLLVADRCALVSSGAS